MAFIGDYLNEMKRHGSRGRCLHFDAGHRCDEIINAHSIQKAGQLKEIAENGHVYRINGSVSNLRKNQGRVTAEKIGYSQVSTFAGFCKKHDNDLFKPIDSSKLLPTNEQVFLYAYRCLCREYFVKENAVNLTKSFVDHKDLAPERKSLLAASAKGHQAGFENIVRHKQAYDSSLSQSRYDDITYVCFLSKSPWTAQFSGLLYPDYDFNGTLLQDLGAIGSPWDLITFFTAPCENGWAFVFAWHVSSSGVCKKLMGSLAASLHNGISASDLIFRFAISCCENHAIRPSWWEGLLPEQRNEITERASVVTALTIPMPDIYLASGLEGIAQWEFSEVISTL